MVFRWLSNMVIGRHLLVLSLVDYQMTTIVCVGWHFGLFPRYKFLGLIF